MEYCIGIDPSMTGTAVVAIDQDGEIHCERLYSTKNDVPNEDRMIYLGNSIMSMVEKYFSTIPVYLEGISFASRGASIAEMAALNYHIRIRMRLRNIPYNSIPATSLKKFICGKGNVKKEQMLLQVYKKFGVEFKDNNLCDAYCLARFALEEHPGPMPTLVKRRKL